MIELSSEVERGDQGSRFRALAQSAPVGIYELDAGGDCRFVNDHWCALAGVEPDAAMGRGWEAVIHPEDLAGVVAAWTRAAAERREFSHEYRYLRPDGSEVWVAGRALAIRDPDGRTTGYLGFALDVTEHKAAQRRLEESSRHFELSHDLVATCSFEGYFKQLNGTWESVLGWSLEELLSNPFLDIVHPEDVAPVSREVERLAAGESTIEFRVRVATRGGGWRWTEWSASPDLESGLFYASGRDITDRVEAQRELERERRQLADAQEIARIGSWELDLETGERRWSAQQFRNLGFDPDGPVPSRDRIRDRVHPDDRERFDALTAQLDDAATEIESEYRIVLPSGTARTIEAHGRLVVDRHGSRRLMGTSRDITAERDAERLKDEFFGLISHELRTPLTSIIGYAELLAEVEAGNLSEQGKRFLEVIHRNSHRELSLVGDLLLLSKITAGTFEIELGSADIGELAAATVEAARPGAEKAGVELTLESAADQVVPGDAHRLRQVFENLVANAVKFTPEGGRVRVRVAPQGDAVAFRVTDTGIGIDQGDLAHLFDRMYRAQEAERRHIPGTGLGLTIVKAIVDAHEATIAVETELGKGTTFTVVLPGGRGSDPAGSRTGAGAAGPVAAARVPERG